MLTKPKHNKFQYISDPDSNYKLGLDFERGRFRNAKHENDYDSMCDAIENIKSEIKIRIIQKGNKSKLQAIENIIRWYRNKEVNFARKTPDGVQVMFPPDIQYRVNCSLTEAYELLIEQLDLLDLL